MDNNLNKNPRTLTRWILTEQKKHPNAKGDLTIILNSITLAIKIISCCAQGAGIFHQLNNTLEEEEKERLNTNINEHKSTNIDTNIIDPQITNDSVLLKKKQRIDTYAEQVLINCIEWCGKISMMASQKRHQPILFPNCEDPKYVIVFDPLDGSQNIEANVSVGTIFGIYRINDVKHHPSDKDLLQTGENLVCAGYALYGDATLIVMTFGEEVNGFTLDPTIGEFVNTHKNIRIPKKGNIYSVNEGNFEEWNSAVVEYVRNCKSSSGGSNAMKLRYIGSMVADVHRTLLYGGIFMYPASKNRYPNGKLGLVYEVNPLAFIVETAGGKASNGWGTVLKLQPGSIHEKTPVFMGSVRDVEALEVLFRKGKTLNK